jgi:putative Ig domain-containing protein
VAKGRRSRYGTRSRYGVSPTRILASLVAVAVGAVAFVVVLQRGTSVHNPPKRVAPTRPPRTVSPTTAPNTASTAVSRVGQAYRVHLSVPGRVRGAWTVVSGELPPGLRLARVTGALSGTPTVAGSYSFVVQIDSGSGTSRKLYTVTVHPPTNTGYERRVASVIDAHIRTPWPPLTGCTAAIGTLTYGMAALWRGYDTVRANNRLAQLRVTNLANGSNCAAKNAVVGESLWLALLVRPYFLYNSTSSYDPGRLTPAAQDNLLAQTWLYAATFCKVDEADAGAWAFAGSENIYMERTSFCLLAAQMFRAHPDDARRTYADRSTVDQQLTAWQRYWLRALDERAMKGLWVETNSTYHGFTIDGLINIYNFADDPVLRRKAGYVIDLDFADLAQAQIANVPGGGASRIYPSDADDGARSPYKAFGDLVFGPTAPGTSNHILVLATSGYYPPAVIEQMATDAKSRGSYEYITRRPGVGPRNGFVRGDASVLQYTYVTAAYTMGGAELDPRERYVLESGQNRWQGVIFDRGTDARVYTQIGPTGGKNEVKAYDAFFTVQKDGAMITRKQGYADAPTRIFFGKSLGRVEEKDGWLFVDNERSYLAVRPQQGTYRWLTAHKNKDSDPRNRFIELTVGSSPIILEARQAIEYRGNFAAFEADIENNPRSYAGGAMRYTSTTGHHLALFAGTTPPQVDGFTVDFAPPDVFNSPYLKSKWGSGHVLLVDGRLAAVYDFSRPSTPTRVLVQPGVRGGS